MLIGRPTADWDAYGSDAHAAQDAGKSRKINKNSHDVNDEGRKVCVCVYVCVYVCVWHCTRTN